MCGFEVVEFSGDVVDELCIVVVGVCVDFG